MLDRKVLQYVGEIRPLISEKSLKSSETSHVVFRAPTSATKDIMKQVVEYLYKDAKVVKLSSSLVKGKVKKFKGKLGKRNDYKKFFIKLNKAIDITSGVKQ